LPGNSKFAERRERGGKGEGGKREEVPFERDEGVCSVYQELAGHLATYASPIKSKGELHEEPAGAPGARFLPLAFSSLNMKPRH
jgi:hypothetical protein